MTYKLKTKNLWYRGKLTCKICGKVFRHLGSHIWHRHKILAKEYKEEFGLPYREALISEDIYHKKVDKFNEAREKYLKNLTKGGNKYQFKKGQSGMHRTSTLERKRIIERIKKVNIKRKKPTACLVCRTKYLHIESHLYNKHRLIKV